MKTFNKRQRWRPKPQPVVDEKPSKEKLDYNKIMPPGARGSYPMEEVQAIFHGAVSGVVGLTRAVRQHLIPDKQLLEVCT